MLRVHIIIWHAPGEHVFDKTEDEGTNVDEDEDGDGDMANRIIMYSIKPGLKIGAQVIEKCLVQVAVVAPAAPPNQADVQELRMRFSFARFSVNDYINKLGKELGVTTPNSHGRHALLDLFLTIFQTGNAGQQETNADGYEQQLRIQLDRTITQHPLLLGIIQLHELQHAMTAVSVWFTNAAHAVYYLYQYVKNVPKPVPELFVSEYRTLLHSTATVMVTPGLRWGDVTVSECELECQAGDWSGILLGKYNGRVG